MTSGHITAISNSNMTASLFYWRSNAEECQFHIVASMHITLYQFLSEYSGTIIWALSFAYHFEHKKVSPAHFNITMLPYQYRKSHWGHRIITRSSYLYNGKMAPIYCSISQISQSHDIGLYHSNHKKATWQPACFITFQSLWNGCSL